MLYTADDITVDAIGDPEAVVAPRDCKSVTIRPKGLSPTIAYNVYAPNINSPAVLKYPGEETIFQSVKIIYKDSKVGYIAMVSGTEDFTVELDI
jgi:hypothetical protein